jgi:hypothetical protein
VDDSRASPRDLMRQAMGAGVRYGMFTARKPVG